MKWINRTLLCSALFIGMSTPVLAENDEISQITNSSSSEEITLTTDMTESSDVFEVNSSDVSVPSETRESAELLTSEESSEDVEEELEEVDYGFGIPNGRSDLMSSPAAFSSRANNMFSITNKNLPKSNFIDVSSHNGYISVADYRKMKKAGVTGVVVKISESTSYTNPYAKDQVKNALAAGMKVSAYHYSWFKTEQAAREEASYFASFVAALGLPKSTVMVNDIEEPKIMNDKNHTRNSQAFTQELNRLGYGSVKHYVGLHWIRDNRIDTQALGDKNIWVAAYPYQPSKQEHTQYGAWQWTDSMTFPGVPGKFDMSSDYSGSYSDFGKNPQGSYISDGRYVTINEKGYDVFSNFSWKVKTTSDKLYQKTYKAKGRYEHADTLTYYSIYDDKDVWQGYINAEAVAVGDGPQGAYISDGSYVKVKSANDVVYNDFKGTYRNSTKNMVNKVYTARGRYNTFEGITYLSLYDKAGKWQGYIKESSTVKDTGAGNYIPDGRYVTVTANNVNIYSNFNWKVKSTSQNFYQKTYLAKGRYEHINGSTYYSLYDNKGEWLGYINARDVKVGDGIQGVYISDGSYVKVKSANDVVYNDFKGTYRNSTKNMLNEIYEARGRYNTFEGVTYLSLYNRDGKWQGYIKEVDTLKDTGAGNYISDGRFVTITSTNYNIYSNFNWKVKNTSRNTYQKTYQAKGRYEHANGSTYYSLYNGEGEWQGYINAKATTVADGRQGIYLSYGKKVMITNGEYTVYQNFAWKYKNTGKNLMSQTLDARGKYNHVNGSTYLSLYNSKGEWQGYINEAATRVVGY